MNLAPRNGSGASTAGEAEGRRGIGRLGQLTIPHTATSISNQLRPRMMRLARQFHALGPRATLELFLELAADLGGDRLPPPMHIIDGGAAS